jgi:hypothetical protein
MAGPCQVVGERTRLRFEGGWTSPVSAEGYILLFSEDNPNRRRSPRAALSFSRRPARSVRRLAAEIHRVRMTPPCAARHYRAAEDCAVKVGFDRASEKAEIPKLPRNKVGRRGRPRHLHAPLYVSFAILHAEQTEGGGGGN